MVVIVPSSLPLEKYIHRSPESVETCLLVVKQALNSGTPLQEATTPAWSDDLYIHSMSEKEEFCELRLYGVLRSSAMHFGVQVSLAYGPTPRDEAGYELTISVVWNPEAFAELPFFQGELEGELD